MLSTASATVSPVVTPVMDVTTVHGTTAVPTIWGPSVRALCGAVVAPWGAVWQPEAWQEIARSGHSLVCQKCAAAA